MTSATCWVIADIRGDFDLLVHLFVHQAKVIRLVDSSEHWEWIAPKQTCVVLLGNLIHCFDKNQPKRKLTTTKATERETAILDFLTRMEGLAEDNDCKIVVLMGHEEVGALLDDTDVLLGGLQDADDPRQRLIRQNFVRDVLVPFAATHPVMARWSDYTFVNAGLEISWFRDMKFESIEELNRRWQLWVRSGRKQLLQQFWTENSIVRSTKMALHPIAWQEHDQAQLDYLLGSYVNPKYIVSGAAIADIRLRSTGLVWPKPSCKGAGEHTILTLKDEHLQDVVFFLNNQMTDVYANLVPPLRPAFVLKLTGHFTKRGVLSFQECVVKR